MAKDDWIDTTEAGGGSYPSPDDPPEYYDYTIKSYYEMEVKVIVNAKNKEDAWKKFLDGDWEELIENEEDKEEQIKRYGEF